MIFVCRTSGEEWDHSYALLEVTGDLLGEIAERIEETKKLLSVSPSLHSVSFWDSSLFFFSQLPEAWEKEAGWDELEDELDAGEWVALPFLKSLPNLEFSRTDVDLMHITCRSNVSWSAVRGHTFQYGPSRVETPDLPELSPLEQLAIINTQERQ